jgi:hypothetical protein
VSTITQAQASPQIFVAVRIMPSSQSTEYNTATSGMYSCSDSACSISEKVRCSPRELESTAQMTFGTDQKAHHVCLRNGNLSHKRVLVRLTCSTVIIETRAELGIEADPTAASVAVKATTTTLPTERDTPCACQATTPSLP